MPIYEYRCKKGHTFDVMQRFSDDPVTVCQVCGAECQRVFRAPAVHFKGSGFYNTDYGTRKRAREKAESSSSSSDGKSSSDTKTSESKSSSSDAKPASSSSDKPASTSKT